MNDLVGVVGDGERQESEKLLDFGFSHCCLGGGLITEKGKRLSDMLFSFFL